MIAAARNCHRRPDTVSEWEALGREGFLGPVVFSQVYFSQRFPPRGQRGWDSGWELGARVFFHGLSRSHAIDQTQQKTNTSVPSPLSNHNI